MTRLSSHFLVLKTALNKTLFVILLGLIYILLEKLRLSEVLLLDAKIAINNGVGVSMDILAVLILNFISNFLLIVIGYVFIFSALSVNRNSFMAASAPLRKLIRTFQGSFNISLIRVISILGAKGHPLNSLCLSEEQRCGTGGSKQVVILSIWLLFLHQDGPF